ncbi:MAG: NAD(P)H-hydrate dehydratase [Candidatus Micrarchaeota archaeon]|nr:NAD(P)H-hydrate dehydratase [Candidatus Micrarchaeota archaeon]
MSTKNIVNSLYIPKSSTHKGQNGKLMIIGGSKAYHGAPIFSILAARRFVDLLYFHPAEYDEFLVNAVKNIPEVIVEYDMYKIKESDCVLFGIGINEVHIDEEYILKNSKKLVIDGDGLKRIKNNIPIGSLLTPHETEFKMLFELEGTKENVKKMAKKYKCVILKKGIPDIISDGINITINNVHNQGMTKGGTGDVLAGLVAALACKNDIYTSAIAATYINGCAGNILKKNFGFNFCASDLAEELANTYHSLK